MDMTRGTRPVSRRQLFGFAAGGALALALAACGQPAASPAPAAKPTEAPKPAGGTATPDAAAPTTAPAAAPAAASKDKVAMRWTGLDFTYGKGFPEAFAEAGDKYGATFTQEVVPGDYIPRVLAQIAAGQPPDIFRVENQLFTTFMSKSALLDLTAFIKGNQEYKIDEFFPQLVEGYTWQGKQYGLPEDLQPASPMFYNKKLFDEAGEKYPTNDWDWATTLETAKRLTKSAGGRVTQFGYHVVNRFWMTHIYAYGGSIVDDIKQPKTFTLDSKAALDGMQYKVDLIHTYKVSPTPEGLTEAGISESQLFSTGRVAMYTAGTWETADFLKAGASLKWGMVLTPKGFDGTTRKYATGGSGWAIPANHKDPERTWKILSYVVGADGFRTIIKNKPQPTVWFMAHKQVAEEQAKMLKDTVENIDIIPRSAAWVSWYPRAGNWVEIRDKLIQPGMDLIIGAKTPVKDGLMKINAEANKALAQPG